jgi:putative spermidine/putrescine transport system ATP-binding protein
MTSVTVRELSHAFGAIRVLEAVDLSVREGEFLTLLGSSGSGKTTLLRLIAGMLPARAGSIHIGDRDVTHLPPRLRNIGFVFQSYALFPTMSVFDNVAFPLARRRVPRQEIAARVHEMLAMVRLADFADRRPQDLSGGQRQRVALARAVVFKPDVLLMDEPMSALDRALRRELQQSTRDFQRRFGITTIYVTHDQDEAFALSDRIAVMRGGRIVQVDEPRLLYERPVDGFVASFVGDVNRLPSARSGVARSVGVRPEKISLSTAPPPGVARPLSGTVASLRYAGPYTEITLTVDGETSVSAFTASAFTASEGDRFFIAWNTADEIELELDLTSQTKAKGTDR